MNATETDKVSYEDIIRGMGYVPSLSTKRHRQTSATLRGMTTIIVTHLYVVVLLPGSRSYGCSLGRIEKVSAMNEGELRELIAAKIATGKKMTETERASRERIRSVLAAAGYYTLFQRDGRKGEARIYIQVQRTDLSESRGLGRLDVIELMNDEALRAHVDAKFAVPSTRSRGNKRLWVEA